MKATLGIGAVETFESGWLSCKDDAKAQVDLLIDRKDGVIHLCEMKYTDAPYEVTKEDYDQFQHRLYVFMQEEKPKKAIHVTVISDNGFKQGRYDSVIRNQLTGDDLFGVWIMG